MDRAQCRAMSKKAKTAAAALRAQRKGKAKDIAEPIAALSSVSMSALRAGTRATIPQVEDTTGQIEALIAALSIQQRALAKELGFEVSAVPAKDDLKDECASLALERVIATAMQELQGLTPSDQRLFIILLTNELSRISASIEQPRLPDAAPEEWDKRDPGRENPAQFVRRVYAKWIGNGLTRPLVRQLDMPLYRALAAWISRHPEDDFGDLPSLSEAIDQKVARLSAEFTPDELRRLGLALQNRARRA